jgi:hypothetical protein
LTPLSEFFVGQLLIVNWFRFLQLYDDKFQIWTRPISPVGSFAIAAVYFKQQGNPLHVSLQLSAISLTAARGYNITEVFDGLPIGTFLPSQNFTYAVNPSGIVFLRAVVL